MELALIAAALLLATTAVWLTSPLLGGQRPLDDERSVAHDADALLQRKAMIYQSIRDAELDLVTGKLSSTDHEEMVKELKREAASIIRALDDVGSSATARIPASGRRRAPGKSKKAHAKKLHRPA